MNLACKHGHTMGRYKNGQCKGCMRERSSAWQKANPYRAKVNGARYRARHKGNKNYEESERVRRKKWNESPAGRAAHKKWQRNNPELMAARQAKYRALRKRAIPSWADLDAIRWFYLNRPPGYHVDHIIPLQSAVVCGLHVSRNLQYLPALENRKKSNSLCATPA